MKKIVTSILITHLSIVGTLLFETSRAHAQSTELELTPLQEAGAAQLSAFQNYQKGIELFAQQKYEQAIQYFHLSRQDPNLHWRSELRIGIAHFYLEQYRESNRRFLKIIHSTENYEHDVIYAAYFYYGCALFFENHLDLAAAYLEEARDSSRQPMLVKEAQALLKEIQLFMEDPSYKASKKMSATGYVNEQFGYDTNAEIKEGGIPSYFNRLVGLTSIDLPRSWKVTGGVQYFAFNNLYLTRSVNQFDSLLHGPSGHVTYYFNEDHSISLDHKLSVNWFYTRENNAFSPFTTTYELLNTAQWSADLKTTWSGTFSYHYSKQNRSTTNTIDTTGHGLGLGINYAVYLDDTYQQNLSCGLKGQYLIYTGSESEYYDLTLSAAYSRPLISGVDARLSVDGRYNFYPKHANQRADLQLLSTLAVNWSPLTWMSVGPSFTVDVHGSNTPAFRYFKFTAFLNLSLFHTLTI